MDIIKLYEEAIKACDVWRAKPSITKATPNEIHLRNIFTQAKRELEGHLACIEDSKGIYMKDKNGRR